SRPKISRPRATGLSTIERRRCLKSARKLSTSEAAGEPPLWVRLIDLFCLSVMCVLSFDETSYASDPWTFGPLGPVLRVRAGCTRTFRMNCRTRSKGSNGPTSGDDFGEPKGGAGRVNSPRNQPIPAAVSGPCHYATADPAQPFPKPLSRKLPISSRGDAEQKFFEYWPVEAARRSTRELDDTVRDVRSVEAQVVVDP